jgi:hypothetical protein
MTPPTVADVERALAALETVEPALDPLGAECFKSADYRAWITSSRIELCLPDLMDGSVAMVVTLAFLLGWHAAEARER